MENGMAAIVVVCILLIVALVSTGVHWLGDLLSTQTATKIKVGISFAGALGLIALVLKLLGVY